MASADSGVKTQPEPLQCVVMSDGHLADLLACVAAFARSLEGACRA
jgi:hypothetical protein